MLSKITGGPFGVSKQASAVVVRLPQAIGGLPNQWRESVLADAFTKILNHVETLPIRPGQAIINLSLASEWHASSTIKDLPPNQYPQDSLPASIFFTLQKLMKDKGVVVVAGSGNKGMAVNNVRNCHARFLPPSRANLPLFQGVPNPNPNNIKQMTSYYALWAALPDWPVIIVGNSDGGGSPSPDCQFTAPPPPSLYHNAKVHIWAPGVGVACAGKGNPALGPGIMSGTSVCKCNL